MNLLCLSCKKETLTPDSKLVTLTANIYSAPSQANGTGSPTWRMAVKTSRPIKATTLIYFTFINPYFNPAKTERLSVAAPVYSTDTARIFVSQYCNFVGQEVTGFKIDSIVSQDKSLIFKF